MHFGYTIVYVPDVQTATTFYERAFGFRLRFNADDWDYAELETGDTTLAFAAEKMADMLGISITPNRAMPAPPPVSNWPSSPTRRRDFPALRRRRDFNHRTEQTPWGQIVSYVRDQNGVLIEICSPVSG